MYFAECLALFSNTLAVFPVVWRAKMLKVHLIAQTYHYCHFKGNTLVIQPELILIFAMEMALSSWAEFQLQFRRKSVTKLILFCPYNFIPKLLRSRKVQCRCLGHWVAEHVSFVARRYSASIQFTKNLKLFRCVCVPPPLIGSFFHFFRIKIIYSCHFNYFMSFDMPK